MEADDAGSGKPGDAVELDVGNASVRDAAGEVVSGNAGSAADGIAANGGVKLFHAGRGTGGWPGSGIESRSLAALVPGNGIVRSPAPSTFERTSNDAGASFVATAILGE
ncbi:hypothetical protein GCM10023155_48560 [Bremerella cremea]